MTRSVAVPTTLLALALLASGCGYNTIQTLDERVNQAKGQIETQLQRRADLVPNLAVEVLSESNTEPEMQRKVGEYFRSGVELVWLIDPAERTARVFRSPTDITELSAAGTLDGGAVLPGFSLPLTQLFAELDLRG